MEAQATPIEVADTVPPSAPRKRAKKARAALDDYPTPRPLVDAILPYLPVYGVALDPACGAGALLRAIEDTCNCHGIEIDPTRLTEASRYFTEVRLGDALSPGTSWRCDGIPPHLILMNPPFSHATQFAARALAEVAPGGTVAMLARLTFLEGIKRVEKVFAKHGEPDVYVLPRRPQFRSDTKRTDSATCAWFVWGPGRIGRVHHLRPDDSGERKPRGRKKKAPSATTGER